MNLEEYTKFSGMHEIEDIVEDDGDVYENSNYVQHENALSSAFVLEIDIFGKKYSDIAY